jgi:hypothetical protein
MKLALFLAKTIDFTIFMDRPGFDFYRNYSIENFVIELFDFDSYCYFDFLQMVNDKENFYFTK